VDSRVTRWLTTSAACFAGAALVYVLAVHVGPVRRADLTLLQGLMDNTPHRARKLGDAFTALCDPLPWTLLALGVLLYGIAQGRLRATAAAALLFAGASVTTQVLKTLLPAERPSSVGAFVGNNSWPSGHTTAAVSLALGLVLVMSTRRGRILAAAAGAVFAVVTILSILSLSWHYPSDVLGGALVTTAWACIAQAWLIRSPERRAAAAWLRHPLVARGLASAAVVIACLGVVAAGALVRGIGGLVDFATSHLPVTLLGVIAAGAAAILAAVATREPPGEHR
jgi:membrane-associated phospholipid phosphatase